MMSEEVKKKYSDVQMVLDEAMQKADSVDILGEKENVELEKLEKSLLRSRGEIKDDLRTLEKTKIAAVRAATMDKFRDVMEDEIGILPGQEGYRLSEEINKIFERYFTTYSEWTKRVGQSMQTEYEKQNEMLQSLVSQGKGAITAGLKTVGVDTIKQGIFAGRDLLGKMGKTIKFKPWQVTKMAQFATKALPIIGAGIDIVSDLIAAGKEQKRNREFEHNKDELKQEIRSLFKGLNDGLNDNEKFFSDFAPDYGEFRDQIKCDADEILAQEQLLKKFKAWAKKVSETDFNFC